MTSVAAQSKSPHASGTQAFWPVLLPAALFVWFLTQSPSLTSPNFISVSWDWVEEIDLALSFRLDGLSLTFALLITGIGTLILVYSRAELLGHPSANRFAVELLLFLAAMLGLVLADNLICLYIFWELTTLSSFFLIGFHRESRTARRAAWQALIVTSLGGLALLAGLVWLGIAGGSFELTTLLHRGAQIREHAAYPAIFFLITIGALAKSAQFPFHFWLPNAMVAPTAVSAFLHSATMVKAGVYLFARLHAILGDTAIWQNTLIAAGACSLLLGAMLSLGASDMKRMLAMLTISALGLMVMLLGIGSPDALQACAAFLIAHAFYKAALFLVSGAVSHQTGTREIKKLGGLRKVMPFSAAAAVIATVSLAGFGPVLSFIAKEQMLEAAWHSAAEKFLVPAIAVSATVFVFAALVLSVRIFFRNRNSSAVREAPVAMWLPALLLSVAGVVFGVAPSLAESLVWPAASAMAAEPVRIPLQLWHGLNWPFLVSIATVTLGTILFALRKKTFVAVQWLAAGSKWGPEVFYKTAVRIVAQIARWQTRILQNGYLRVYLMVIVGVTMALLANQLRHTQWTHLPKQILEPFLHEIILVALILAAAAASTAMKSRFGIIATLSVTGYGVALLFAFFGAPDLAMTQFLVETLMLVLLVIAFYRLPVLTRYSKRRAHGRDAVIALAVGAIIATLAAIAMGVRTDREVADFFLEHSHASAKGRNVVNVILVDFRALDTWGEITVLVVAALGVRALLDERTKRKGSS